MKKTPFIALAILAFSLHAQANLGENQEELFKRYGKATDSINTGAGFGTHFWRTATTSHGAEMSQGICIREELVGVDESTISRIMRSYQKTGQTWDGSPSFFFPNETRTLRLKGKDLEKGKTPVVKITRDGKKLVFRAEFKWE